MRAFDKFKESFSRAAKSGNLLFLVFLHQYNLLSIDPSRNPLHSRCYYGVCAWTPIPTVGIGVRALWLPKDYEQRMRHKMCACARMCIQLLHSAQKVCVSAATTATREWSRRQHADGIRG